MIIDKTYFVDDLNIPNLDFSENSDLISNNNALDNIISRSSFKYLSDVFGYKVAKEILNVFKTNGQIKSGTDQKYIDLIEGKDDEDWQGLRYEVSGVKYSQIANYVYCQYLAQYENRLTDFGVTNDNAEQGRSISSWVKFNASWKVMLSMRQICDYHLYENYHFDYNFKPRDAKSLYEYLRDSADWDVDKFVHYEETNSLGL